MRQLDLFSQNQLSAACEHSSEQVTKASSSNVRNMCMKMCIRDSTTGYTVVLSNTAGVANGAAPPAPSLPAGWVNTGENNAAPAVAGSDGAINGVSASFDVPLTTVPNRNFGIEQPPTAGTATYPVQTNPGGTGTLPVGAGAFTGVLPGGVVGSNATDPTAVTNIKITAFPSNVTSITINGTTYTSGTFPPSGLTVTVAELAGMNVDPIDGLNTIDIPYVAIDAAGQESNQMCIRDR